jgi:hypothetical protein
MGFFALWQIYVPKFFPLPLAQAKNGDKQFWKQKIQAANGKVRMHSWWALFFHFGVGEIIFGFLVPNVFLTCSHHIPLRFLSSEVVPKGIPNSTSILSHMVCPKFNSHVYKLR